MLRRGAVRALILLVCAACGGSMRPAVIPKLSELPIEPERRDAVLDSAHAEPGPENRPVTKQARKVETMAATAAAIIGNLFSTTTNVTLGGASVIDENLLFEDDQPSRRAGENKSEPAPAAKVEGQGVEPGPLVPWVRLSPDAQ